MELLAPLRRLPYLFAKKSEGIVMRSWLCVAGVMAMLATGPVAAQYITTLQDYAGVWKLAAP